jgi:RNA polymerase sigma-70 factor, ECF subfamily
LADHPPGEPGPAGRVDREPKMGHAASIGRVMTARPEPSSSKLRLIQGERTPRPERRVGPTGGLEDAQLVALAREQDRAAFEVLYRRHAAFAMNLAVRIQGGSGDVEDVVHDAFLRAHARLGELRDPEAFRSWLGAIVVRLVRTRLRRRRLLRAVGIASPEPVDLDAVASTEAGPELRAQLAQIYALLHTVAPDDRIAWTLRHVENHRLEAVAGLCGCSLATAKRRIHRAQRFLSDHFVVPFAEEPA